MQKAGQEIFFFFLSKAWPTEDHLEEQKLRSNSERRRVTKRMRKRERELEAIIRNIYNLLRLLYCLTNTPKDWWNGGGGRGRSVTGEAGEEREAGEKP